jgi:putative restriction endonuclease
VRSLDDESRLPFDASKASGEVMAKLTKKDLMEKVLQAIQVEGWLPFVVKHGHPFLVRATHPNGASVDFCTYIWNCTHGGHGRSAAEFRVQFTTPPKRDVTSQTLLLGWHDDKQVFAAWDIDEHDGQSGSSSSAQIRENTLEDARESAFSVQVKENEIVVAFRPAFLIDYVLSSTSLHQGGPVHRDMALLNDLDALTDAQIDAVPNVQRRNIIRTITTKYRAQKFRGAVLGAYGHRCAFCRVQLSLLDAAHILPVSAPGSTDEIVNGIALCKLHHFAYDSNLVSFDTSYQIAVSKTRVAELQAASRHGGLAEFEAALNSSLHLPANLLHRPNLAYIKASRKARGWRP